MVVSPDQGQAAGVEQQQLQPKRSLGYNEIDAIIENEGLDVYENQVPISG